MSRNNEFYCTMKIVFFVGLQLFLIINSSYSQDVVGTDVCSCQPLEYVFKLDLSLSCMDSSINNTIVLPGISETNCNAPNTQLNETLIPVMISDITVIESNIQNEIIGSQTYSNTFRTGDSISFTSSIVQYMNNISSMNDDEIMNSIDVDSIPYKLSVTMNGNTADDIAVISTWDIVFTNDCQIYPVLYNGLAIGWTTLVVRILFSPVLFNQSFHIDIISRCS